MADEVKVEKKKKTRKKKQIVTRGKRKEAIARAYIKAGKGIIRINGLSLNSYANPFARQIIAEPLSFLQEPYDFDISITTNGGGIMGQAQAARTAIARALIEFRKDGEELKKQFLEFDRSLYVEDARRVEPKKFKGPKARARFTKSYR
ncbi:MAG TPA: 30S ribosomal protein S9 [Candidatus Norongarragalinales archaeon]|nr:30S ribosomal protein S9 [Candidatus Norongarragalinales archaeon]